MKDWWISLRPREQLILLLGSGAVLAALFYLLAIEPFLKERATLVQRISAQHQQLAWMQQASQQVRQLRARSSGARPAGVQRSLLSVIDSSARRNNIRKPIQRMEPEGNTGVRLWIENADFDKLIGWLGQLNGRHGVNVVRATISQGNSPGLVDTRLSLQRQ